MQANNAVSQELTTAGFPERFVAYLIDAVILIVAQFAIQLVLPYALGVLLSFVVAVGYFAYFWSSSGQTPGKSVMNLRVVSAETGELLDPGKAILRYVGYLISALPLALGFLWIIWDEKKEGWHDKIAKTRVVKVG